MENPIPVFSLTDPDFEREVTRCLGRKRNIIVIGTSQEEICERLKPLVKLNGYSPDTIRRWGIYALHDVLEPEDLSGLLEADRANRTVCIVEQLKLPATKPPRVKPVIVYSEPQGLIAEMETVEEAKRFLAEHNSAWSKLKNFPLAGIFEWRNSNWSKARVFV